MYHTPITEKMQLDVFEKMNVYKMIKKIHELIQDVKFL